MSRQPAPQLPTTSRTVASSRSRPTLGRRSPRVTAGLAAAVVALASLLAGPARPALASSSAASAAPLPPPAVTVQTLVTGLDIPWDLAVLPGGAILFDKRQGGFFVRQPGGAVKPVVADLSDLTTKPGLLGLVLDPQFPSNRLFYTCQTFNGDATSPRDVRVVRWHLASDRLSADRVGAPVLTGIDYGDLHVGCRLRFGADGSLFVTTGDAEIGTAPQSLASLAGKTLRVRADGTAPSDNPYAARGGKAAYIWTIGHRNPEGLALRPGTDQMWISEMGTDRDDEINLLAAKGNYGWDPVPGYDETTPMTDLTKFPYAKVAKWSSGFPTIAPSGLTFLQGSAWGPWQGAMAAGLLKDEGVLLLRLGTGASSNKVVQVAQLPALDDTYGRIRTVQTGPDGSIYLTTSNGGNADKLLKVTPTG